MTNNQQPFPNDPLLRALHAYREPAPAQSDIEREQARIDAERAAKAKAEADTKADAEALEAFTTYRSGSAFMRARLRLNYGSATIERGRALYAAREGHE